MNPPGSAVTLAAVLMSLAQLACTPNSTRKPTDPEPDVELLTIPSQTDAVDFRILFLTGSVDDPQGKEGLTALCARLLIEGGTELRTYPELLRLLYPLATAIRVQVDKEMTVFHARVHRDHLDQFVPLLAEVLSRPGFAPQAFERLRTSAVNSIRKGLRMADDEQLSIQALDAWIHEGHPYGHPVVGTIAGLEAIRLSEVRAHFKDVFTQDRLVLAAAGAVNQKLATRLRQALGSLPVAGKPRPSIPAPRSVEGIRIRIVEKNTGSTAITLGYPLAVRRDHQDYIPLWLAQSALGEHRNTTGRLFQAVRHKRGLNYGDYAYIEPYIRHGQTTRPILNIGRSHHTFNVWIRPVQHKHRLFTVRLVFHALSRFAQEGLNQEELDRTRDFLDGYTRSFEDSVDRKLGYALDDRFYRTQGPFLDKARSSLPGVTLDKVNQVIQRHIRTDDLRVIIVTSDAQALKRELAGGASAFIEYDTPKPDSVLEEDSQVAGFDPGFRAEHIEIVPVDELFEK